MSPNPNPTITAPPNPSKEGTPEWLYNEIMRFIEPDLLTNVIPTHAEKYSDQSKEECLARIQAYDRAFAVFDRATDDIAQEYQASVQNVRAAAKADVLKAESEELEKIERKIDEQAK